MLHKRFTIFSFFLLLSLFFHKTQPKLVKLVQYCKKNEKKAVCNLSIQDSNLEHSAQEPNSGYST